MSDTSTRSARARLLLVALLAILPYLNSLRADFAFDDSGLVIDNPNRPTSPIGVFKHGEAGGVYRPLTMVTFMGNERVGGGPFGYHLVNVLLHAATTALAFLLAESLLGGASGALAAATLFAVHPVHTEAVTNIAARAEVLAALFVLASLLTFVRAHRSARRAVWMSVSLTLFIAALLAKENSFAAISLVALLAVWLDPTQGGLRVVRSVLPYALVGAAYLGLRLVMFGVLTQPVTPPVIDNPLAWVPVGPRVATALVVVLQYLSLLAVPLRLSADDSLNQIPIVTSALDARFIVAVLVLALLAAFVVVAVRKAPVIALSGLFMALSMAVTSNILFPIGAIKAERFLYLPSFGWCLACGWLFARWRARPRWRALAATAVVLALATRTWLRNDDWRNNFTLFTADVPASPNSARANNNVAAVYAQAGELFMAMYHYQQALAIFPQYATAAAGLAQVYELKNLDDAALHWYAKAVKLDHHLVNANLRRGALLLRKNEPARAEIAFRAGLKTARDDPRLLVNLALARLAQHDEGAARALLARAESVAGPDPALGEVLAGAQRIVAAGAGGR